jgi:hypothetical protein
MNIIPVHLSPENALSRSNVVETTASYEDARALVQITRRLIAETIIFPTVTYGSESWTVRKKEMKKKLMIF